MINPHYNGKEGLAMVLPISYIIMSEIPVYIQKFEETIVSGIHNILGWFRYVGGIYKENKIRYIKLTFGHPK